MAKTAGILAEIPEERGDSGIFCNPSKTNHVGVAASKLSKTAALWKQLNDGSAVNLCNQNIDIEGVKVIAKGLENNTKIKHLGLKNNNIGDIGVALLVRALKNNATLMSISLDGNGITKEGERRLRKELKDHPSLKNISLDDHEKPVGVVSFPVCSIVSNVRVDGNHI